MKRSASPVKKPEIKESRTETNVRCRRHRVVTSNVRIAAAKKSRRSKGSKADFNLRPKARGREICRPVCETVETNWSTATRSVDYTRKTAPFCLQSTKWKIIDGRLRNPAKERRSLRTIQHGYFNCLPRKKQP